jgi:hypothetical protein
LREINLVRQFTRLDWSVNVPADGAVISPVVLLVLSRQV